MRDLISAAEYEQIDRPLTANLERWVATAHVGVLALPVTLVLTEWSLKGVEFWRGFCLAAAIGIVFGLIVSVLSHWAGQHRSSGLHHQRVVRLLAGESPTVPAPPTDATARALCAVLCADGRSAGGFLYVCADRLVFQPHQPAARASQHLPVGIAAVTLSPVSSLVLQQLWLQPRPWWKQPILRAPRPVLQCASAEMTVLLVAPPPAFLRPVLQEQIDGLRRAGAA